MRHRLCQRALRLTSCAPTIRSTAESQYKRESRRLYRNVAEVLGEVGASFPDVVRVDQYYTTARAMHPYHEVRHEVFKGTIPPSTSNLHQRFARTEQTIEVQVMAAVPGAGLTVKHETFSPSYKISPVSGYSPALSAGDFRFVPDRPAKRARRMKGRSIRSCATRARSGVNGRSSSKPTSSSPRSSKRRSKALAQVSTAVVKAQVYLSDREDVPGFNEVWLNHFKNPPATTIIATASPGFSIPICKSRSTPFRLRRRARRSAR